MSKTTKVILIIVLIILIVGGLIFFWLKFNSKIQLPGNFLSQLKTLDNISLPQPLSGPKREESAQNLIKEKIIKLTNQERNEYAKEPLSENNRLDQAAERKLDDMFENQYFEHVSPVNQEDISSYVLREEYQYSYVGENLALGDFQNEEEMLAAWMASFGHRENILSSNYTQIGVAVKKGDFQSRNTWLAVQVFADPAPSCTLPDQSILNTIKSLENEYQKINEYNSQIKSLQAESLKLIDEGNNKIKQGNQIYSETKNKSQAEEYWNEGEELYNLGVDKNNQASELINMINELTKDYKTVENLISEYNSQIENYNQCISQ